ncbi:MAG: hypothetical protein WC375_02750 [Methanomassiliicoccales archaeon]
MSNNSLDLEKLKDVVQDGNISFLIGSGLSTPFLSSLGNIEDVLTDLDKRNDLDDPKKSIIRASLYKRYCEQVIFKNIEILENNVSTKTILESYKTFLTLINSILLNRKNPILSKQINIFTTNIDIFLEKALEEIGLEYNDGFNGRFVPIFNLSNFRKSAFKKSPQYDNVSEIPVFNLMKLHGSLTWEIHEAAGEKGIKFCPDLNHVRKARKHDTSGIAEALPTQTLENLITQSAGKRVSPTLTAFLDAYQDLPIINPTKDKFKQTLLNQIHYELLRMYANELEKENSVLFVMGFSFADEHLREITLRVADSNPTLMIYIIAHSSASIAGYEAKLRITDAKNRNIKIIHPNKKADTEEDDHSYDFVNINSKIFESLAEKIEKGKKTKPYEQR